MDEKTPTPEWNSKTPRHSGSTSGNFAFNGNKGITEQGNALSRDSIDQVV
jgi:hypothetical protein